MKKPILILICILLIGCAAPDLPAPADPPQETAHEGIKPEESTPSQPEPTKTQISREDAGSPNGKYWELTLVEMAVRDLALRLGIDLNTISVAAIESVVWPDTGLGCPLEGMAYAQVETPGTRIQLEAGGQIYLYHTNLERALLLCEDGAPLLPLIPVSPGEIQDGVPWMPVDPVPTVSDGDWIADPDPVK